MKLKYEEGLVAIEIPRENRQGINFTTKRFFYAALINSRKTRDFKDKNEYIYPLLLITPIRPSAWPNLVRLSFESNYVPGAGQELLENLGEDNINILFCQYKKQRINLMLDLSQYKPLQDLDFEYTMNNENEYRIKNEILAEISKEKDKFINKLKTPHKGNKIHNYNRMEEYLTFYEEYLKKGQYQDSLFVEKEGVIRFAFDSHMIIKLQNDILENAVGKNKKSLTYFPLGKKVILFTDHFKRYLLVQFVDLDYNIEELKINHDESPGKLLEIIRKFKEVNINILHGTSYLARFKDDAHFRVIIEVREHDSNYIQKNLFRSLQTKGVVYKVESVPIYEGEKSPTSDSEKLSKLEKIIPRYSVKIHISEKKRRLYVIDVDNKKIELMFEKQSQFKILTVLATRKDWIDNREIYAKTRELNVAKVTENHLRIINNELSSIRKKFKLIEGNNYDKIIETKFGFTRISTQKENISIEN